MTGAFLKGAAYGDDSGDARHPGRGIFAAFGRENCDSKPLMQFSTDELAALIPAADAVVACGALPGEIIRRGRKLRIIAGYGAGYDGVDVRAAAECGIPVTNLPDTVTDSTAELAIGLMLAVSRRIGENSLRARGKRRKTCSAWAKTWGTVCADRRWVSSAVGASASGQRKSRRRSECAASGTAGTG